VIKKEVLDALVASGATAEMIVAAVCADGASRDEIEKFKTKQRERNQRAYRRRLARERANPPEEKP
jgi:hypothetical protein